MKSKPVQGLSVIGAFGGAVVLGAAYLLLFFLVNFVLFHRSGPSPRVSGSYVFSKVLPSLLWGALYGSIVHRGILNWRSKHRQETGRTWRTVGGYCLIIHLICLWPVYAQWRQMNAFAPGISVQWTEYFAIRLGMNVPLQGAALLLFTGMSLARDEDKRVQITDKLRL
jgi:hypothetical protein